MSLRFESGWSMYVSGRQPEVAQIRFKWSTLNAISKEYSDKLFVI